MSPGGIIYHIAVYIPSATIIKRAWYWRRYDKQDQCKSGNKHKCMNSSTLLSFLIFPWQNSNHCYINTAYSIQELVQLNMVNKNKQPSTLVLP